MKMPALLLVVALLTAACATAPADDAQVVPATTTTTTTTTAASAPEAAPSDELAFADATNTTESAVADEPSAAATPSSADAICEALEPIYLGRAAIRTTLLTATEEEASALLEAMRSAGQDLAAMDTAAVPGFDPESIRPFVDVEGRLPNRLNRGGALFGEDLLALEARAEPLHTFTQTHCVNIGAELLDYGSADGRSEDVFAEEDRRRTVTYCTHLETLLSQRQNLRTAIAAGVPLTDETVASFIGLFADWTETADELIRLNEYVDWTQYFEFKVEDFLMVEMELRQATLGPGYIPVTDHTIESAESGANAVTESAVRMCPDLDAGLLIDPPSIATYVNESYNVPPEVLRLDDFNTAADYCVRAIPLLYAHDALVQHLEALDPQNTNEWVELQWVAFRAYDISGSIANTIQLAGGGNAEQQAADAIAQVVLETLYGDVPASGRADWERDAVATLRAFTATECPAMPAALKGEPGSVLELLGDVVDDRPEAQEW